MRKITRRSGVIRGYSAPRTFVGAGLLSEVACGSACAITDRVSSARSNEMVCIDGYPFERVGRWAWPASRALGDGERERAKERKRESRTFDKECRKTGR